MHFNKDARCFALAGALAGAASAAQAPMSFDCSDGLQDVCSHMCWGAYCTTPAAGVTFHYDNYQGQGGSGSVAKARRRSAGCLPEPNRCSTKGGDQTSGQNCDEYPFASVSESDAGGQTNQCVVSGDNSRQGGVIASYFRSQCGGDPCEFTVAFGNPTASGVKYCEAYNDISLCVNDGSIFKNGKPDADPAGADASAATSSKYKTASGMEIILPSHYQVGQMTKKAVRGNATVSALEGDVAYGMPAFEWDFVDDEIVEKLN